LFSGRSQLLVYHFMFGPEYTAGCPACSAIADGFNGFVPHLENHDVAFTVISRAPFEKLRAYRRRMGWIFPWASSYESDFNHDFNTSVTDEQQRSGVVESAGGARELCLCPCRILYGPPHRRHSPARRWTALRGHEQAARHPGNRARCDGK